MFLWAIGLVNLVLLQSPQWKVARAGTLFQVQPLNYVRDHREIMHPLYACFFIWTTKILCGTTGWGLAEFRNVNNSTDNTLNSDVSHHWNWRASWGLARFCITIKFSFLSGEVPHVIVKNIPSALQVCSFHYSPPHTHTPCTLSCIFCPTQALLTIPFVVFSPLIISRFLSCLLDEKPCRPSNHTTFFLPQQTPRVYCLYLLRAFNLVEIWI